MEEVGHRNILRVVVWLISILLIAITSAYLIFGQSLLVPIVRPILQAKYKTPTYKKILLDYKVQGIEFSINSPFAMFTYDNGSTVRDAFLGTGLFNLESEKTTILAPHNSQPSNTSIFSPDGKRVLHTVVNEQKTKYFTNENGTWRTDMSSDLFVYDTESDTETKLSTETFPVNNSPDAYGPVYFGWINDNDVFYYCSNGNDRFAYCFLNTLTKKIERKNYLQGDEQSLLSTIHVNRSGQADLTHSDEERSSFDKTATIFNDCKLGGYDGCAFMTIWVKHGPKNIFLVNRDDLDGKFYWSFGNHIYVLPYFTGNKQLFQGLTKVY